jgi:hypothetical protein
LPWKKKKYALSWLTAQTDVPPYPTEGTNLTAFVGKTATSCGDQCNRIECVGNKTEAPERRINEYRGRDRLSCGKVASRDWKKEAMHIP